MSTYQRPGVSPSDRLRSVRRSPAGAAAATGSSAPPYRRQAAEPGDGSVGNDDSASGGTPFGATSRAGAMTDYQVRSQQTMRRAAQRADGRWAENRHDRLSGLVHPHRWARPADETAVFEALLGGQPIPHVAWRPAALDFGDLVAQVTEIAEPLSSVHHPLRDVLAAEAADAIDTVAVFAEVFGDRGGHRDGNALISRWAGDRWGGPSAAVLNHAHTLLNQVPDSEPPPVTWPAERVAATVRSTLEVLAPEWTSTLASLPTAMLVDEQSRAVTVDRDRVFTRAQVMRLLVSHVGVGVLRRVNSADAEGSLARLPLGADAEQTEDGLALWWEHRLGVSSPVQLRLHAARVAAVSVALRAPIDEVVSVLAAWVPLPTAVRIAMRVKRGMTDPYAPGAWTSDHGWLSGFDAVTQLLTDEPKRVSDLMHTRWGLSVLPCFDTVRAEGLLTGTARLPDRATLLGLIDPWGAPSGGGP